jgi:hypothetical protein
MKCFWGRVENHSIGVRSRQPSTVQFDHAVNLAWSSMVKFDQFIAINWSIAMNRGGFLVYRELSAILDAQLLPTFLKPNS